MMISSILFLLMNRDTEDPPQYVVLICIPTSRIANMLSNFYTCLVTDIERPEEESAYLVSQTCSLKETK